MSDDLIEIEVDGKSVSAKKGQMIIEATDQHGAYVPRFCYHTKLSIAANCRMCLVEVEKAPKPLPACATPIAEGMKIFTKSPYAIAAQKATMEFLLINHPLDCPICDQGGECELQDLAMGYGRGVSRYNDNKRVVKDKNIGPLVSTDMTRCIHCTRCVRFGEEITGAQDLGTVQRGENMKIDTYIEKSIDHELSSNIIDLCPVGALNNKPYRYSARSWEMIQHETIAPHDCVGSNLFAHVLRGRIKRIVPRENELINETWISDRDRFSYEGIYSSNRLEQPKLKVKGKWKDISWEKGLASLAEKIDVIKGKDCSILASPSSTLEEYYLLSKIAKDLGIESIDHRLRKNDFSDQDNDPLTPWLGLSLPEIENCDQIVVVGSDIRKEAPIIAHRVRKSALNGSKVSFINNHKSDYYFDISSFLTGSIVDNLKALMTALNMTLPSSEKGSSNKITPTADHIKLADVISADGKKLILLGNQSINDPQAAQIRFLSAQISRATGAVFGYVTEGANSFGAYITGVLPHRNLGGALNEKPGQNKNEILNGDSKLLMLWNAEPNMDIPNYPITKEEDSFTVAFSPYFTSNFEESADLIFPIGTFAETSGTYINCEGRWQSFNGIASPVHESRPGWKVLRVLANMLNLKDYEFESSIDVLNELKEKLDGIKKDNNENKYAFIVAELANDEVNCIPMYQIDSILRHSPSLQLTPEGQRYS